MAKKSKVQQRARDLQSQTGWSYMECLRQCQTKTDDEIDMLILERAKHIEHGKETR